MNRAGKMWTDSEEAELARLAPLGLDAGECGRIMGRTSKAIASRACELSVSLHGNSTSGARAFIKAGGRVTRDTYDSETDKPALIYWTAAHRSAECDFPTVYMETLLIYDFLVKVDGTQATYRSRFGDTE